MSGLPDVEALRLLVLVGELGSLGRAAAELGITQPSASKRVATLERRLGLALIERTRRGSTLTTDGQAVADRSQRVLDELTALMGDVEAHRSRLNGTLRVAASMTVAEYLAPAWISELCHAHPDLHVGLQVTNSDHVPELLRSGAVEIGFIESPFVPRGLISRTVATDRLIVVVAPAHPWARRRRPLLARELAATALVVRERGSGTRVALERALRRAGAQETRPLLELGSAAAVRGAVIAGTGPAVISELAVRTDIVDGRLVQVSVEGIELRRALRAVWPAGRSLVGPAADLLAVASHRPS
ncbi:LysR family transcriptional regulator [Streptomyces toyocaensis]|uniref:LysR family transcriptional regulator n=1 Tax=Streptomyces toyocaensis TaxID=55952 RepID=A0A081XJM0_STRTO|nr:LysR family transcriptional regulator [Streptomyces toyocaensis]KES03743.1 LysR family transcriptional regulator [Streptomyces toyocaensis]